MKQCILDTDILSFYLKKIPIVVSHAEEYLKLHGNFTLSVITYYEVLRGLEHKEATAQIERFKIWVSPHELIDVNPEITALAASIHGNLRSKGITIGDPDVIIAATALHSGLDLNTNNTKHYKHIPQLSLLNWNKS